MGVYSGTGVQYDPSTGKVVAEGEFRNGVLLTSKKELDAARNPSEEESEGEAAGSTEAAAEQSTSPKNAPSGPGQEN